MLLLPTVKYQHSTLILLFLFSVSRWCYINQFSIWLGTIKFGQSSMYVWHRRVPNLPNRRWQRLQRVVTPWLSSNSSCPIECIVIEEYFSSSDFRHAGRQWQYSFTVQTTGGCTFGTGWVTSGLQHGERRFRASFCRICEIVGWVQWRSSYCGWSGFKQSFDVQFCFFGFRSIGKCILVQNWHGLGIHTDLWLQ